MVRVWSTGMSTKCPVCGQYLWNEMVSVAWKRGPFTVCTDCVKDQRKLAGAWIDGWDECAAHTK